MKTSITRSELRTFKEQNQNIMVIDVRSREEYYAAHISFAGNLPVEIIEAGHFLPEPGKIIVTVCGKGGGRSERAANYLRETTSGEVYFLEGGTFGWLENSNV